MIKLRFLISVAAVCGALAAGDYYNIIDKFVYPFKYYKNKPEENFHQSPFSLEKMYVVNEKGNLETYIGNNNKWVEVKESMFEENKEDALKDNKPDMGVVERTIDYLDETVDYLFYLNNKFGWSDMIKDFKKEENE